MDLNEAIKSKYGGDAVIIKCDPVTGGDINRAYALKLSDGRKVFVKANRKENADFFRAEVEGLAAIRRTESVRVPDVIAAGTEGNEAFLLLEHIQTGSGNKTSSEELGEALAHMHKADTRQFMKDGRFGFLSDNYIGAGKQINTPKDNWAEFFTECRLLPQFERAQLYFGREERKQIDALLGRIDRYMPEPEHPSLLHGDLWSGNYMVDQDGHPWLIDPAVYVGHAEADLAMTELFGGFDRVFYDAYRSVGGIDPGYRDRKDLYNLYHLLNHLNLFGGGYLYSVKSVINRYI